MIRDYATCELEGLSLGAVETYSGSSATNLTTPEDIDILTTPEDVDILPPVDNQPSATKAFLLRARENNDAMADGDNCCAAQMRCFCAKTMAGSEKCFAALQCSRQR